MGVGEPKLMTRVTMSCGSKDSRTSGSSLRQDSAQPFLEGLDLRRRRSRLSCTASQPSSGPPFQR